MKLVERDVRIGIVEMLIGWNLAALEGQRGLDEADDARGRFEVAEVGFGGTDQQRGLGLAPPSVDGPEGAGFDGIAQQRSGAVRLHIVDFGGLHIGVGAGGPQHGGLSGRVRRHQTVGPAVLIDRRPEHNGEDSVAVAHRVGEPLEHGHPAALAAHESIGGRVEGVAATRGRHGPGLVEAARHDR